MAHGVASTKGHLASNGGLRGHSVGDCFPYIVYAQGLPNDLTWRVRCPDGISIGNCQTSHEASELGKYLQEAV